MTGETEECAFYAAEGLLYGPAESSALESAYSCANPHEYALETFRNAYYFDWVLPRRRARTSVRWPGPVVGLPGCAWAFGSACPG